MIKLLIKVLGLSGKRHHVAETKRVDNLKVMGI